jgi:multimeric flavodoxin WrbA
MANILILNGAPRKNGSTASLIKAFTEGAQEAGNEIREAYIQGMDVKNCLGCDACMKTNAGCVQKDEGMEKIYSDLEWCDTIVFASPVHFGYMTAQLKTVIDRMWAWFNLPDHFGSKRRVVLISTARGQDYSTVLNQYDIYPKYMGWEDLGHILGAGEEYEARRLGKSIQ